MPPGKERHLPALRPIPAYPSDLRSTNFLKYARDLGLPGLDQSQSDRRSKQVSLYLVVLRPEAPADNGVEVHRFLIVCTRLGRCLTNRRSAYVIERYLVYAYSIFLEYRFARFQAERPIVLKSEKNDGDL